ncbi:MAG: DUF4258 domain-containing protein [Spirochaetota bacterium]|nr:DUF4258 domain-containing protein [Spirochaetota bacterium]
MRACCADNTIVLTDHLLTRMRQRHIRLEDIKTAITEREIIELYPPKLPGSYSLQYRRRIFVYHNSLSTVAITMGSGW